MPGNQRIESVINKSSVGEELTWLVNTLKETHSLIINTPQVNSMYKNSDGIKEFKKNTDELISSNQKLLDMQKQLEAATQRVSALEKKLAEDRDNNAKKRKQMTDEELKAAIQLREETKKRTDAIKAENDAYKQLTLQYNQAAAEAKKLQAESLTDPKKMQAAEEAATKAKSIWDQLKGIDASVGQFFKNVGNYPESAKIIVDALERQKQKVSELNSQLGETHPAAQAAGRELQNLERITNNPQFLNVAARVGDSNAELKAFTKTMIELERTGLGKTDFANELRKHLAELKDSIDDTRGEIKKLSSDSHAFDEFAKSVSFLASTYQTAVGAQELFGSENKEVEESMKKLLAVQALANGVQQIAQQLTDKGTLVNKAYVAVQTLVKTALDSTASASVRAAAATKLLLGGLVIGGLVLLVIKLKEWADAATTLSAKQKTLIELGRAAADSYGKEKSQLDLLMYSINAEGVSRKEKFKILKQLQDAYPGYFDNIKTEKDLNEKLADAYKRASEGILMKANAEAASNMLAQNASDRLKAQFDLQEKIQKINQYEKDAIPYAKAASGNKGAEAIRQTVTDMRVTAANEYKKLNDDLNKKNEVLVSTIQDSNSQILKLGGKPSGKPDTPQKSTVSDENKLEDAARKAAFDTRMQQMQDEMNAAQRVADNDKANFVLRMAAAQHYFDLKKKFIEETKTFELGDIDAKEKEDIKVAESEKKGQSVINKIRENAAAQRKLIEAKSNSELLTNSADRNSKERDMFLKHIEDMKKVREEKERELAAHKQSLHEIELQNISNQYEAELLKLDESYAKKKTHSAKEERDYNNAKLKLQEEFQVKSLQADIAFTKETLDLAEVRAKASGKQEDLDSVAKAKAQLSSLEIKLVATVTQFKIDQNKKADDSDAEAFNKKIARLEKYAAYSKELEDIVGGFVQNSVDKQKNALQDKQDLIDKNYEKEVSNIQNSTLSEEDKAARLKILEAEKLTQTEQIERKKRQMDIERARFDKAANIANILTEIPLAVMRALSDKTVPYPVRVGYAIAAGAIGAASLVKAIATPLPRFKDGTESSPEGFALTDEEGPEMYIEPSGKTYMGNSSPTIRYLEEGTRIIPYEEVNKMLLQSMMKNTIRMIAQPDEKTGKKIDELKDLVTWQTFQLKEAYKNSRQPININISDFKNSDYIKRSVRE
jgi:hypothetical protein